MTYGAPSYQAYDESAPAKSSSAAGATIGGAIAGPFGAIAGSILPDLAKGLFGFLGGQSAQDTSLANTRMQLDYLSKQNEQNRSDLSTAYTSLLNNKQGLNTLLSGVQMSKGLTDTLTHPESAYSILSNFASGKTDMGFQSALDQGSLSISKNLAARGMGNTGKQILEQASLLGNLDVQQQQMRMTAGQAAGNFELGAGQLQVGANNALAQGQINRAITLADIIGRGGSGGAAAASGLGPTATSSGILTGAQTESATSQAKAATLAALKGRRINAPSSLYGNQNGIDQYGALYNLEYNKQLKSFTQDMQNQNKQEFQNGISQYLNAGGGQ